VLLAAFASIAAQFCLLVASSLQASALLGLGLSLGVAVLLFRGAILGWLLAAFWAASALSAPFVFASPFWVGVSGAIVAIGLLTKSARAYCFGSGRTAALAHPLTIERDVATRMTALSYEAAEAASSGQFWRRARQRIPILRLSRKQAFLLLLASAIVFMPLTGVVGKLYRGSGRGDLLVEVLYHFVSVTATFAQVGLIIMLIMTIKRYVH
jgi:hypothetical protein